MYTKEYSTSPLDYSSNRRTNNDLNGNESETLISVYLFIIYLFMPVFALCKRMALNLTKASHDFYRLSSAYVLSSDPV